MIGMGRGIDDLRFKAWTWRRKRGFDALPPSRRVRLDVETEGRHIPFLIRSLHALGYGLQVAGSPVAFGELMGLRDSTPIPFTTIQDGPPCGWVISDTAAMLERAGEAKRLLLDYDFFNPERKEPKMPYFPHPDIYRKGLDRGLGKPDESSRPVRVGFFGTRDARFYTEHFHFPILDREAILADFLEYFAGSIQPVDAPPSQWQRHEIAVSLDDKGGDRMGKTFLPLPEYLEALRRCDFFLSPPGWCMPLSHNLIEGMACGAVPIINSAGHATPPLEDGVNCLVFDDLPSLRRQIETALAMIPEDVLRMRGSVLAYYREVHAPGVWLKGILESPSPPPVILVNGEEVSVGVSNVPAGA